MRRAEVQATRVLLLDLAARIRETDGRHPAGVILARRLLIDPHGPLFAHTPPDLTPSELRVADERPRADGRLRPPRGHHKIFLGMAAGMGKTYRMLQEGRAEADAGRDVVIGYLEPHRRPETTAQAAGLEIVPRRRIVYRDVALDEMDLPSILRRAPQRCLIDELAHTSTCTRRSTSRISSRSTTRWRS